MSWSEIHNSPEKPDIQQALNLLATENQAGRLELFSAIGNDPESWIEAYRDAVYLEGSPQHRLLSAIRTAVHDVVANQGR